MGPVTVAALSALGATALGLLWVGGEGRLRRGSRERVDPAQVALPDDAFGPVATLLLFTSQQDDRAPRVRAMLIGLAAERDGVRVAEVDLTVRGDLAGRYAVTLTPTLLVLDADHRLRVRVKGVAEREVYAAAVARGLPAASRP